ncbi:MAG: hypothetical protein ABW167_00745 [Baekduia sp.]
MNTPDRTESQPPHVPIPDHLNFAVREVVDQGIRETAAQPESDRQRIEVSQALHLRKAFLTKSLTPAEVAELAQRAAQWLQIWPKDPQDTEEVERLLHAAHDLLVLRDHALDVAQGQSDVDPPGPADQRSAHDDGTRVLTVTPDLLGVLRSQSLLVLEWNHEPLEDIRELEPSELVALASILWDAMVVLYTIGWLPTEDTAPIDVAITTGHIAQLQRLRNDLARAILDQLDDRATLTDPDEIVRADADIDANRLITNGLLQLIQAHTLQ